MSRSHDRAIAQNLKEFAQILENCMRKLKKYPFLTYIFHKYYVILGVIFALFLAKKFKNNVLTTQKHSCFQICIMLSRIHFFAH